MDLNLNSEFIDLAAAVDTTIYNRTLWESILPYFDTSSLNRMRIKYHYDFEPYT